MIAIHKKSPQGRREKTVALFNLDNGAEFNAESRAFFLTTEDGHTLEIPLADLQRLDRASARLFDNVPSNVKL